MIAKSKHEHLLAVLAGLLPVDERTAVLGDLQEENRSLLSSVAEILGYAVRLELAAWRRWQPWLVLLAVTAPLIVMLGSASLGIADGNAVSVWCFASNWDFPLLHQTGFWSVLRESLPSLAWSVVALVCWSWSCGALIGTVSQSTTKSTGLLICLFFALLWIGWRPPTIDLQPLHLARDFHGNEAAFRTSFYRDFFSPLVQLVFVVTPILCGVRSGGREMLMGTWITATFWLLVSGALVSLATRSSAWWLMHTWTTFPTPTHHLPSLIPLALSGGLAWFLTRGSYINSFRSRTQEIR